MLLSESGVVVRCKCDKEKPKNKAEAVIEEWKSMFRYCMESVSKHELNLQPIPGVA